MVSEYDNLVLNEARDNSEGVPDRRDLLLNCSTTTLLDQLTVSYHRTRTIIDQPHSRTFLAVRDLI